MVSPSRIRIKAVFFISCLFITRAGLFSQNYHAIQGSSYAGSLGVANNPASIVNTPFAWDVNLLSVQAKSSTNALTVLNYSLLSSPLKSMYNIREGNYSRYINTNYNLHLFNARLALSRQQAIAFGINLRGYAGVRTGRYNFLDTVKTLNSFLKINESNAILEGRFKSSLWIEVFATYSRTLWDRETGRLNGGLTVKVTRGISGAFLNLENTGVRKVSRGTRVDYLINSGNASYGYSSNFDKWQNDKNNQANVSEFINSSQGNLSVDLGMEYLVKSQAVSTFYDEDGYNEYEWKIGVALLDLGRNKFTYGNQSRSISNPESTIPDTRVERKFSFINSIRAFNDSLVGVVNDIVPLTGKFTIINPARLMVNIDRSLINDFYLNGEISLNLSSLAKKQLYTSEMNLITLTPRWETRKFGVYLPLQYNTEGQFWMGGALKAGPLLFGVHNLSTIIAKNRMQNGGVYFALVLRPGNSTKSRGDKRNDCPKY